jgi:hypothetical protein
MRRPALRALPQIVKGNEKILTGPLRADEGEAPGAIAFAGIQGRNDADHGRPV